MIKNLCYCIYSDYNTTVIAYTISYKNIKRKYTNIIV